MAKKKTSQKSKPKRIAPKGLNYYEEAEKDFRKLNVRLGNLEEEVLSQSARIDRIVDAISKSKSVKGL